MSMLDKAFAIALFLFIFSASLSALNNNAIGIGAELGVAKNVDVGPSREELAQQASQERDLTPFPGVDYFFRMILAGWKLIKIVLGIPFAVYSTITAIVPGSSGRAVGLLFQGPVNLVMVMGLAMWFKR